MEVACDLPLFSIEDLGVQIFPVVKIDNASESSYRKYLWLSKRIPLIEEDLELEVALVLLDCRVPFGAIDIGLVVEVPNLPLGPGGARLLVLLFEDPLVVLLRCQSSHHVGNGDLNLLRLY